MAINQISTANTFEQWLIATQSLIAFANSITGTGGTFTANTSEYIITGNLTVGNTVTAPTVNTDVIIFDDGTRLTTNSPNVFIANTITANLNITTSNITVTNNATVGNITATLISATDFNTTSDVDLKINMQQITNSLDVIEQLTGFVFNWKSDGKTSYGVSAQQVEQILPDLVRVRDDGFKGVNYLNLIAFLIEAVKDLKKEIMEIKNNNK